MSGHSRRDGIDVAMQISRMNMTRAVLPTQHSKPATFGGGAIIGALGGLIGLGGAEFRLPLPKRSSLIRTRSLASRFPSAVPRGLPNPRLSAPRCALRRYGFALSRAASMAPGRRSSASFQPRRSRRSCCGDRQPLPQLRPSPPLAAVPHRNRDSFPLANEDDELLAPGDASVEEVARQHGVVLGHHRDHHGRVSATTVPSWSSRARAAVSRSAETSSSSAPVRSRSSSGRPQWPSSIASASA